MTHISFDSTPSSSSLVFGKFMKFHRYRRCVAFCMGMSGLALFSIVKGLSAIDDFRGLYHNHVGIDATAFFIFALNKEVLMGAGVSASFIS